MTQLTVTLKSAGTDIWQGEIENHPGKPLVHVRADTPYECSISLWKECDSGRMITGHGRLFRDAGKWFGSCSDMGARWEVSGVCGTGELTFSESK